MSSTNHLQSLKQIGWVGEMTRWVDMEFPYIIIQ